MPSHVGPENPSPFLQLAALAAAQAHPVTAQVSADARPPQSPAATAPAAHEPAAAVTAAVNVQPAGHPASSVLGQVCPPPVTAAPHVPTGHEQPFFALQVESVRKIPHEVAVGEGDTAAANVQPVVASVAGSRTHVVAVGAAAGNQTFVAAANSQACWFVLVPSEHFPTVKSHVAVPLHVLSELFQTHPRVCSHAACLPVPVLEASLHATGLAVVHVAAAVAQVGAFPLATSASARSAHRALHVALSFVHCTPVHLAAEGVAWAGMNSFGAAQSVVGPAVVVILSAADVVA